MKLYFSQHGLAKSKQEDPERPLSIKGIAETKQVAEKLQQKKFKPNVIFHSGKLRAKQTAKIFSEYFAVSSVNACDHLSPNDDPTLIIEDLKDKSMYVGHLPHLEKVISLLITGDENSQVITYQNSAVACVTMENNHTGAISWIVTANN